jgi:adenosine deaminase
MGWYPDVSAQEHEYFRTIPKIELHRHLEGSLRYKTVLELVRKFGVTLPISTNPASLVQVMPGEPMTYSNFLSKFQILRMVYRSREIIERVVYEAIADAAEDNIRYLELRFTPVALARSQNFKLNEVMDWVCATARKASRDCGVITRLIASVNRHEDPGLAQNVARFAVERIPSGIVGLDLAGNEADFPADPFISIFQWAKERGLNICVHAGEWGKVENVRQAIEEFRADRIGHGVRVLDDLATVDLARKSKTIFEVCITSNHQTGVVPTLKSHPVLRMLEAGLHVTINTDDPAIQQVTLGDEYRVVVRELGMPLEQLKKRITTAACAAMLPPQERMTLVDELDYSLKLIH